MQVEQMDEFTKDMPLVEAVKKMRACRFARSWGTLPPRP